MSTIAFRCSTCNQAFQVPDSMAGTRAKCTACGTIVTVPAATSASVGMIVFSCPQCRRAFEVPPQWAGTQARCVQCGTVVTVPGGATTSTAPAGTPTSDPLRDPLGDAVAMSSHQAIGQRTLPSISHAAAPRRPRREWSGIQLSATAWTVIVSVIAMLILALLILTSTMPLAMKGRVLTMSSLLLSIFPPLGLAAFGRRDLGGVVATSCTPFLVIGLGIAGYAYWLDKAVPVTAMPAGNPTDAYPAPAFKAPVFSPVKYERKPDGKFWTTGDVSVTNWTGPAKFPEFQVTMEGKDWKEHSKPCLLYPLYTDDLLTREPIPMERGSDYVGQISRLDMRDFVRIRYWLPGKVPQLYNNPNLWREGGKGEANQKRAIAEFRQMEGGLTNARLALELALTIREVDPKQIYASGTREAALVSLLLAAHDSRLRGCVVQAPVTDITSQYGAERLQALSATLADMSEFAIRNSPITHAERMQCPILIVNMGTADRYVREEQVTTFADKLKQCGKDVQVVTAGGQLTADLQNWFARLGTVDTRPAK